MKSSEQKKSYKTIYDCPGASGDAGLINPEALKPKDFSSFGHR
jgi:hypothetical protein